MNKMLTLSVIIPAFNEEAYLASCLNALMVQTVQPDEVIVVDNNSSDKTVEIAKKYPHVRLIREKKQGLYHSRQTGMDAAKSDIVARIDADTIVDAHWVETIKNAFMSNDVQAVTGPVGYHDMPLPEFTKWAENIGLKMARAGQYDFMMGANMAIRKSAWKLVKNELCNEPFLFEDIDIVMHLRNHNIRPDYLKNMSAFVSSRRFDDNPKDFMRYIGGHTRTHEHHDQPTPVGVHFAEAAFALTYLGIKPLHMAYDPKKRRPSLARLRKKKTARPDPMHVK